MSLLHGVTFENDSEVNPRADLPAHTAHRRNIQQQAMLRTNALREILLPGGLPAENNTTEHTQAPRSWCWRRRELGSPLPANGLGRWELWVTTTNSPGAGHTGAMMCGPELLGLSCQGAAEDIGGLTNTITSPDAGFRQRGLQADMPSKGRRQCVVRNH